MGGTTFQRQYNCRTKGQYNCPLLVYSTLVYSTSFDEKKFDEPKKKHRSKREKSRFLRAASTLNRSPKSTPCFGLAGLEAEKFRILFPSFDFLKQKNAFKNLTKLSSFNRFHQMLDVFLLVKKHFVCIFFRWHVLQLSSSQFLYSKTQSARRFSCESNSVDLACGRAIRSASFFNLMTCQYDCKNLCKISLMRCRSFIQQKKSEGPDAWNSGLYMQSHEDFMHWICLIFFISRQDSAWKPPENDSKDQTKHIRDFFLKIRSCAKMSYLWKIFLCEWWWRFKEKRLLWNISVSLFSVRWGIRVNLNLLTHDNTSQKTWKVMCHRLPG